MLFGETLETSLRREIKEEVGLDVVIENLLYATTFHTDPTRQIVLLSYLCQSKTATVTLSEEHSDYRWATREDARLLLPPEIIRDFENHGVFSLDGFE
ncbi:MAG TPA: NUDIX domain-containing protein [Sporolactobacillaceae bacterium]|nr:NUDIX domain-containing protein [Sporolactobacillaceae bacterium]